MKDYKKSIHVVETKGRLAMATKAKLMYDHGARKEGTNTYYSPKWVTDKLPLILGDEYLDPCPGEMATNAKTFDSCGLALNWSATGLQSYVNPPFSDMQLWLNKVALEVDQGHSGLWFTKLDFRTEWGAFLTEVATEIFPVLGYVRYLKEDGTPWDSATFQTCFALFGSIDRTAVIDAYGHRLAGSLTT